MTTYPRGFDTGLLAAGAGIWRLPFQGRATAVRCDGVALRHAIRAHSDEGAGWWYQGRDFGGDVLVCAPAFREQRLCAWEII